MTIAFHKGRYGVRLAASDADVRACQALRHRCFFGTDGYDADSYDPLCNHLMIANETGLVGTCRTMLLSGGADLGRTYAASAYDLTSLAGYDRPMLEVGRFCIDPQLADADVLRLAWGGLAQLVDQHDVAMLFGCSSFDGIDPKNYRAAFQLLATRFQGPQALIPKQKADGIVSFTPGDTQGALAQLPPLLRTYLSMGGWVGDHAVIDPVMHTMHVFTALEIAQIPPRRAAALRAIVADIA